MKTIQITTIAALILLNSALFAQEIIYLEQCYQMAGKDFPTAKQIQLQAELLQLKLKNIRNDWMPALDFNAQASYQSDVTKIDITVPIPGMNLNLPDPAKDQYKLTADISQMVYDGGIIKARQKVEDYQGNINEQTIKNELFALREKINQQYFYALILQENRKQLEVIKADLETKLKSYRSAIQNGTMLPSGADVLEVEILKTEQQSQSLKEDYAAALANLAAHTGNEQLLAANLAIPVIEDSMLVGNQRPEHILFETRKKQSEAFMEISAAGRRPKLIAFAQAGYGKPGLNMMNDSFDSFYIVGAKFSWKLWDWNESKNEKQQFAIQAKLVENQREVFDKNISITEIRLRSRINQLTHMLASDNQIIELRQAILARSASALNNGTISPAEYVNDLTAQSQAIINQQIHLIQLAETKTNLKTLLGN